MKKNIESSELKAKIDAGESLRIIDVRTPSEFARGHIPGATNVPLGTIEGRIAEVASSETLVLVCQGGMRSDTACDRVGASYRRLYNLVGGTSGWRSLGYPVEVVQREPRTSRAVDRQAHFVAGSILCIAFVLFRIVDPRWIYLALLPALGLLLDATTGFCPMTWLLKRTPWNSRAI
ncbi:MAG: rhodanese-like domain-containing protein [Fimbriimonas sp.]|nr:rhodanese-like domain-containing protein [Fimbriimonas sp.]